MSDTLDRLSSALAGRYTLERELGRGGMATVFLATDVKHGREVAIKVLHPELSASLGAERFDREIHVAARLQHPHILTLYDSGEADGLLFYVMPFVKGESLRDRLDREGPLPIEDAIQVILEVSDALHNAHQQGIVHRDIKPENIMLSGGHALVADFGIARAVSEGGAAKLTQTGIALGTPVYMSPEQASGEAVGPAADIYSLGCMLYEMLAGEPPFSGKTAQAIIAKHVMEGVPSVRIVRNTVPEEIEEAIFAAMAKVPADRPKTAEAFAEMLAVPVSETTSRRAMRSATVRRHTGPRGTQAFKAAAPIWRRPAVLAAAAIAVAAAGIGGWYVTRGSGGASGASADNTPPRLAVLYFADSSASGSLGYLADGLTEDLIADLTAVRGLSVVSTGGVEPYRSAAVADDSIAKALGVGTIVRGVVDTDGDKTRVRVRLVDGTGKSFDDFAVSVPATQQLALRDSVAQAVASHIRQGVGAQLAANRSRASTRSAEAWTLALRAEQERRAMEAAARARDSAAVSSAYGRADALLEQAEAADRRWGVPIVRRGELAYRRSRMVGLDALKVRPWVAVGLEHAQRALALDSTDADARELRGNLRYWSWLVKTEADPAVMQQLYDGARDDYLAATAADSLQAGAWASLSHLYYQVGNVAEVARTARKALAADAFLSNADVILNRLFLATYDLQAWVDAEQWCSELQRRYAGSVNAYRCRLFLQTSPIVETPDPSVAWALVDSLVAAAPPSRQDFLRLHGQLLTAAILAKRGLADSARKVLDRSQGTAEIDGTRDLQLVAAWVDLLLDRRDDALRRLQTYLAVNPQMARGFVEQPTWWYESFRNDPRFLRLGGR